MMNFDTELDEQLATTVKVKTTVPPVRDSITVRPAPARPAPLPAADEGWEDLRDYVMDQILKLGVDRRRDTRRENTVFMGFHGRWQNLAMPIAKYAFEGEPRGFWMGAPVGVFRFDKTSDEKFAKAITALL